MLHRLRGVLIEKFPGIGYRVKPQFSAPMFAGVNRPLHFDAIKHGWMVVRI